eukprot:6318129-Lingulodinium_polyedra.AAC.1
MTLTSLGMSSPRQLRFLGPARPRLGTKQRPPPALQQEVRPRCRPRPVAKESWQTPGSARG